MHEKDGKCNIQENDYLGEKSKEWNGKQAGLSDLSNFQSPDFCLLNFSPGLMSVKYKHINNCIRKSRACSARSWLWTKGLWWGSPCSSVGKVSVCNAGDLSSNPGSGRFPGEGNGSPLRYSCLENPMERRAWQATVWGCNSRTWLSDRAHTQGLWCVQFCITPNIQKWK